LWPNYSSGSQSPASDCQGLGSITWYTMWYLWHIWYWGTLYLKHFNFPFPVTTPPMLHILLSSASGKTSPLQVTAAKNMWWSTAKIIQVRNMQRHILIFERNLPTTYCSNSDMTAFKSSVLWRPGIFNTLSRISKFQTWIAFVFIWSHLWTQHNVGWNPWLCCWFSLHLLLVGLVCVYHFLFHLGHPYGCLCNGDFERGFL
jgi:hypothetical protein